MTLTGFLEKLWFMLTKPEEFFESTKEEGWVEPLKFLLIVSVVIAFFTPIVNFMGVPQSDYNSSFQAQIIAYRLTVRYLLQFGHFAYILEGLLILVLVLPVALVGTIMLVVIYGLILPGDGGIREAWKAICYGVGPCVFGGWLPYWALLVGSLSFVYQLYLGPKVLYRVATAKATIVLAIVFGLTLIELITMGTTVGFID